MDRRSAMAAALVVMTHERARQGQAAEWRHAAAGGSSTKVVGCCFRRCGPVVNTASRIVFQSLDAMESISIATVALPAAS